jgi:hypothetical protein
MRKCMEFLAILLVTAFVALVSTSAQDRASPAGGLRADSFGDEFIHNDRQVPFCLYQARRLWHGGSRFAFAN